MWKQLKSGQQNALTAIYNLYYESLFFYGKGLCKDIELVEDAIHDVFVKIWNDRERLSETDNIKAYLLVSVRHKVFKLLKKEKRYEPNETQESLLIEDQSIERQIINQEFNLELKGRLERSYSELSNRQRQAIFLRYHESMEYEDICRIMDINYQSVRNLISSGVKKLAVVLKNKF